MPNEVSSLILIRSAEPADLPAIHALLTDSDLPVDGVRTRQPLDGGEHAGIHILIAEAAGEIVAVAALERHGSQGLLRSVATSPRWRGEGIARLLVRRILETARAEGLDQVHLLTTSAAAWFSRIGFEAINRADTPPEIRGSPEFASLCPSTAAVMRYRFSPE